MDTQQLYRLEIMAYGVTDPLALAKLNARRLEIITGGESPEYLMDELEQAHFERDEAYGELEQAEDRILELQERLETLEDELDNIRRYGCSSCESSA